MLCQLCQVCGRVKIALNTIVHIENLFGIKWHLASTSNTSSFPTCYGFLIDRWNILTDDHHGKTHDLKMSIDTDWNPENDLSGFWHFICINTAVSTLWKLTLFTDFLKNFAYIFISALPWIKNLYRTIFNKLLVL